jgi:hypothetical protein
MRRAEVSSFSARDICEASAYVRRENGARPSGL